MECNVDSLIGYAVEAIDGEIGKVYDFYFDDEAWTIHYLVVTTDGWLTGSKVLIPVAAFMGSDIRVDLFKVNMTMEKIRLSPDIDTDKPVSRQKEAMLNKHYFWQNYWKTGGVADNRFVRIKDIDRDPTEDIHLRSIAQMGGHKVHASDGEIGRVNNFIVDDKTWELLDFVIDTHKWIGKKKVLVSVANVLSISFLSKAVYLSITKAEINNSKLYEEAAYSEKM